MNPDSESMVFSQICHFCHEMNTAAEGPLAHARANASRKATEKTSKKMTPKKKSMNPKKKKAKPLNKNDVVDKVPGESFLAEEGCILLVRVLKSKGHNTEGAESGTDI